jgi:hypothetical protein
MSVGSPTLKNRLLRSVHRDEHVLIAFGEQYVALQVLLLLADERPCLVQFEAVHPNANHHTVIADTSFEYGLALSPISSSLSGGLNPSLITAQTRAITGAGFTSEG